MRKYTPELKNNQWEMEPMLTDSGLSEGGV